MQGLNVIDRNLLQFCAAPCALDRRAGWLLRRLLAPGASTNLAGVRWLLVLGANRRVTAARLHSRRVPCVGVSSTFEDQKGTTCLHAACRSGSCSILEVLVLLEETETGRGRSNTQSTGCTFSFSQLHCRRQARRARARARSAWLRARRARARARDKRRTQLIAYMERQVWETSWANLEFEPR